jgi:diguanylate cyclase (GGDEF)-like protein
MTSFGEGSQEQREPARREGAPQSAGGEFPSDSLATLHEIVSGTSQRGTRLPPTGRSSASLRGRLARVDGNREQITKAWLADVVLNSPLDEVERMPVDWATRELPELISDILEAVGEGGTETHLTRRGKERAARLADLRAKTSAGQLSREVAHLHANLLGALRREFLPAHPDLFADAAARLAAVFGLVGGAAVDSLFEQSQTGLDPLTGLHRPGQMRSRLSQLVAAHRRYGSRFALVLFDAEGPGTREESQGVGPQGVLQIVSAALRDSIRQMDEGFRLEENELAVLAPDQTSAGGEQMAMRLGEMLNELEAAGGLRITISAGVVSCPEHGDDPEQLLRRADTAMWRARATGRLVSVGPVQEH